MAGHVISIIGGKGGVGKSQFAANLAFAFAAENRQKALLLDFDQKASGDQNLITGIKSKKTIKDLSEFNGAIDPRSINMFVGAHKMGVHYIGMPNDSNVSDGIEAEGLGAGFDIDLYKECEQAARVPIIACGGFGKLKHIKELKDKTKIDAIAISQALHYEKISINEIKEFCKKNNINVRN